MRNKLILELYDDNEELTETIPCKSFKEIATKKRWTIIIVEPYTRIVLGKRHLNILIEHSSLSGEV